MIVRCEACGSSLRIQRGAASVVCRYCGATTLIPTSAAPTRPTPPASLPPSLPTPRRAPRSRGLMVWVRINVALTVAIEGVWWLSSKGAMTLFHEWYSAPCLVDANGDGALDPAGWSGTPDAQHRLTAVDGRTGDVLWTGDGVYPAEAQVICAGRGALIVTRPDFGVEVRDAKTGALRGTLRAPTRSTPLAAVGAACGSTRRTRRSWGFARRTPRGCPALRRSIGIPFKA